MKTPVKQKVTLTPPATFQAIVEINMPGGAVGEVKFTFKHRTKSSIKELIESLNPPKPIDPAAITEAEEAAIAAFVAPKDVDVIMDMASGWDLDDPFDAKSVERMTEVYVGSSQAIINTYLAELSGTRVKN